MLLDGKMEGVGGGNFVATTVLYVIAFQVQSLCTFAQKQNVCIMLWPG